MNEEQIIAMLQGKWRSEDGLVSFEIVENDIIDIEGKEGISSVPFIVTGTAAKGLKAKGLWEGWNFISIYADKFEIAPQVYDFLPAGTLQPVGRPIPAVLRYLRIK